MLKVLRWLAPAGGCVLLAFSCDADRSSDAGPIVDDASTTPDASTDTRDAAGDAARDAENGIENEAAVAPSDAARNGMFTLPPANASLDYQLGGDYPPPAGVRVVSRDRGGEPASGLYNICYVNGFQTQPGERDFWLNQHPTLVLRGADGEPVIDPDWPDEMMLDVSTPEKRSELIAIETAWLADCAQKGFDAVEIDNLDTFTRSGNRIREDDAVAFIRLLADAAHANGLAIGQKNSAEIVGRRDEMTTDFAVAEECNRYDECGDYTAGYGQLVFVIEYDRTSFERGCSEFPQLSIVLRDRDVSPAGSARYVFEGC